MGGDLNASVREMAPWEVQWSRLKSFAIRVRRRLPYVVWYGDELDVKVTLRENRLTADDIEGALQQLHQGSFYEVERHLADCGITFDKGLGPHGRDWEWDWSLGGPISVTFRGRASKPDKRGFPDFDV